MKKNGCISMNLRCVTQKQGLTWRRGDFHVFVGIRVGRGHTAKVGRLAEGVALTEERHDSQYFNQWPCDKVVFLT